MYNYISENQGYYLQYTMFKKAEKIPLTNNTDTVCVMLEINYT